MASWDKPQENPERCVRCGEKIEPPRIRLGALTCAGCRRL